MKIAYTIIIALIGMAFAEAAEDSSALTLVETGGVIGTDDNLARSQGVAIAFDDASETYSNHTIAHLNDGKSGNNYSWLGASKPPSSIAPSQFAGVAFKSPVSVGGIAWGRDNQDQVNDRCLGTYTIQYTKAATPGMDTPDTEWITIGTVTYDEETKTPHLRHKYRLTESVTATAIRLLVPNGTCIDELEIYPKNPALTLVETGGSIGTDDNLARSQGVAIAWDDVSKTYAIHTIAHLNDGKYGDNYSWLGAGRPPNSIAPSKFAGVAFKSPVTVAEIAWGRDNQDKVKDRCLGTYTIQYTKAAAPGKDTPDSEWKTVGSVTYNEATPAPHLRHKYRLTEPVIASAIRLLVPSETCIDELEIYPKNPALTLVETGGTIGTDDNLARSQGVAIAWDDVSKTYSNHTIAHLNDGKSGNNYSWVGASTPPSSIAASKFAGVAFDSPVTVAEIAWGRDNQDELNDRCLGTYTVQYTTAATPGKDTPDSEWKTVGSVTYNEATPAPHLRHKYRLTEPMTATAIRLLVPSETCIDEIEIYPKQ